MFLREVDKTRWLDDANMEERKVDAAESFPGRVGVVSSSETSVEGTNENVM